MTKLLALLLLVSTPAFAEVTSTDCDIEELDGYASVSIDSSVDLPTAVTSTLFVGGEEAPAVRQHCFFQNVPGTRGFLCVHELHGIRYQVYPRFKFSGEMVQEPKIKRLQVIVEGTTFNTTSCN